GSKDLLDGNHLRALNDFRPRLLLRVLLSLLPIFENTVSGSFAVCVSDGHSEIVNNDFGALCHCGILTHKSLMLLWSEPVPRSAHGPKHFIATRISRHEPLISAEKQPVYRRGATDRIPSLSHLGALH